ncbi:hypothetical protein [Geothrix alkalitolerans]|uniref:hypothetical protein n=1 Tax=Geothrix alkalitolerans TaxID=2922724 RepID=UPI001FB012CA|nr:hypothetical protein [Geothrix alkalitolerans]
MPTTLSFRKESIQQASSVSEALNRRKAAAEGQGQRTAHEPWAPTLTTTVFTI